MHRWVAARKRGGDVVVDPRTHALSLLRKHRRSLWTHAPATRLSAVGLTVRLRVLLVRRLHRRRLVVHASGRLVHIARRVAATNVGVPIVSHCKWRTSGCSGLVEDSRSVDVSLEFQRARNESEKMLLSSREARDFAALCVLLQQQNSAKSRKMALPVLCECACATEAQSATANGEERRKRKEVGSGQGKKKGGETLAASLLRRRSPTGAPLSLSPSQRLAVFPCSDDLDCHTLSIGTHILGYSWLFYCNMPSGTRKDQ